MKRFLTGAAFLLVLGLAGAGGAYYLFFAPQSEAQQESFIVIIPQGAGIAKIAALLQQAQAVRRKASFVLAAKLTGYETRLQAGKFKIKAGAGNLEILKILNRGKSLAEKVTIPEGATARKIASILARQLAIDSTSFMALVNDSSFVHAKGIAAGSLEGYLFPETYFFPWGANARDVVDIFLREFFRQLPDSAREKAEALKMSLHEIITLASIVEGEAVLDTERSKIAAVYHNRLRRGMRLEADPTIQYIIPGGPRRLLLKDLKVDSPYNTYLYAGLPPGPINNPGRRSIEAALNPADVPYLYMVARGDGSHIFNVSYRQHRKAHQAFNRIRREVARQKRKKSGGRGGGIR